jgi:glycerol-3-phosphate acyltransferase PlsY
MAEVSAWLWVCNAASPQGAQGAWPLWGGTDVSAWPAGVLLLWVLAGYLAGSLSFAVIVSRLMGLQDPRQYGSGNPGATNVLRSGSKKAAVLTLLLDAFKGWLPVFLLGLGCAGQGIWAGAVALVGLAAFLGHVWPVFFRFKGGKGVATAAGVLLAFHPLLGLATLGVWLLVALVFRYSSLAALCAAFSAPVWSYALGLQQPVVLAVVVMAAVLVGRHSSNIRKLLAGQESRLGRKTAEKL